MDNRIPADVFPPGEFLRDELEARKWTQADLASVMGRPAQTISEIIAGRKKITPQTAKGLADALGTSAEMWLNLESAYRLSLLGNKKADVTHRAKLFGLAPVNHLIKRGWIEKTGTTKALERELTRFFGIATIDESPDLRLAARMSADYSKRTPAQKAWFCRAKTLAKGVSAARFDSRALLQGMDSLHELAASHHDIRRVPRLLAEIGIRMVIVEPLKGTCIDGAAIWLSDDKPAVALSMRYDRIDSFWFTLAHELSHIRHGDESIDPNLVGRGRDKTEEKEENERRADEEAADFLIPNAEMTRFLLRMQGRFFREDLLQFASRIRVHPGIIAGQLHHRFGNYSHDRDLLVKVREQAIESALSDGWGVCPPVR